MGHKWPGKRLYIINQGSALVSSSQSVPDSARFQEGVGRSGQCVGLGM